MTKLRLYVCTAFLMTVCLHGISQYKLTISLVDRDSLFNQNNLGLSGNFKDRTSCTEYVYKIPSLLQAKGFSTVSIDSTHYDSLSAFIRLYLGQTFKINRIHTKREDFVILNG